MVGKTRIFASKKKIESKQLGCWVDSFLDVEFLDDGMVRLTVRHISSLILNRTHTFSPVILTRDQWDAIEHTFVESFIEY